MASLQQIVEQVLLSTNSTTYGPDPSSAASVSRGPPDPISSALRMLFSASALRDWVILLAIGSLFETARRLLSSLWSALINAFFITAVFDDHDVSFHWVMHWLSQQPSWKGARNVHISTSDSDFDKTQLGSIHDSRKVTYLPAVSGTYVLWYKYRKIWITRTAESRPNRYYEKEMLTMTIMAHERGILAEILEDAKKGYAEAQANKITIWVSENYNWKELATRPKRPLDSIILEPGIKELVIEDVQDFLSSKEWYAERGIPFRRGYLLYGAPGSGKTSLIHSIAGELGLDVYIISLSRSGLDDMGLSALISTLPERCIALMEDIDAALHQSLNRDSPQASQTSDHAKEYSDVQHTAPSTGSSVSLSGLLNALDGIGAQEGRVLFATTNKYRSLDPALCRPGRIDLHVEFKLASRFQAGELFKRFYASSSPASASAPAPAPAPSSAQATENSCATGLGKSENGVDVCEKTPRSADLVDPSTSRLPSPSPLSWSSSASTLSSSPLLLSPSLSITENPGESLGNDPGPTPSYAGVLHRGCAPTLSCDQLDALAAQFALAVPERQLSMACLQGYLMMHKTQPIKAVADMGAWVEKQLAESDGEKGV